MLEPFFYNIWNKGSSTRILQPDLDCGVVSPRVVIALSTTEARAKRGRRRKIIKTLKYAEAKAI